jgi:hypothetical protein
MEPTVIAALRSSFNGALGSVRLITFLSPTCGPCRYGQGVVRALFEEFPDEKLAGFVVWVPMLPTDDLAAAKVEQDAIEDTRLRFWYDADRAAADTWSWFIGLSATTWDVYAVYDAASKWPVGEAPERPRIWMHQLNATPATREADRLNTGRMARQWLRLLGQDSGDDVALGLKLHAKGTTVSARSGV